jgi:[ribosomal protein S5]-alanine N-acetyltransferase
MCSHHCHSLGLRVTLAEHALWNPQVKAGNRAGGRGLIETDRLIVRLFKEEDCVDLHDYLSNPVVYEFEPGDPITLDQARELAAQRSRCNDFLAVELKETGRLVGHLYFKQVEPPERMTWELGYIFNPKHHGNGYATEASSALVLHAFRDLKAHRIMARCDPRNVPSWKLLERIGFKREGHFSKCGYFRTDESGRPLWHDAYEYARLEDDP